MPKPNGRLRRTLIEPPLAALPALRHRLSRWDPRRLRRELQFRRWNRAGRAGEMVLRPRLCLRIDPRSREPFEAFCFRSLDMSRELDAFLHAMTPCRRFLDVGACHGLFSLAFALGRAGALALAVEPSAPAFEVLAENIRLNRLDNVLPRQLACGPRAGQLRMRQVWHHLVALPESRAEAAAAEAITVPMRSLDEICSDLDFAPDLIKIDVEGYELGVLEGARSCLRRNRPRLFLELHPRRLRELGASVQAVTLLLQEVGYCFRGLSGAPLDERQLNAAEPVSRFVCLPLPPAT
jgi:FkbM family methyltransferase